MPKQLRESRKNYIGILNDMVEDQHAAESPPKSGPVMKDYLLGLMAALLNRDGDAR